MSTPTFVAPEGLVFCLATPSVSLSSATFSVSTLVQGGTQFDRDGQTIVDDSGVDLGGVSFFQTKTAIWDQSALEFGTLYDVLANDDYFSSSYVRKRYDDLESKYNTHLVPSSGTVEGPPNCVLITGSWKANTRYALVFNLTNPQSPGGDQAIKDLAIWHAPVTYTAIDDDHTRYALRGLKEGQVCAPSENLALFGTDLYDSCQVLDDVLSTQGSDPEACLSDLKTHYENDGLPGRDQYSSAVNVYLSALGMDQDIDSVDNTTCAGENSAFSENFGGECISCGTGTVEYVSGRSSSLTRQPLSCSCPPPDHVTHITGSPVCGGPKSLVTQANTTRQVAASLCDFYSGKYDGLLRREVSALSVIHTYVEDFLDQGHLMMDREDMSAANETFASEYVFDERKDGSSPTRRCGIKPNCYKCDDGKFEDFSTGALVEVTDHFFDAVHVFRLIGFALHTKGKTGFLFDLGEAGKDRVLIRSD